MNTPKTISKGAHLEPLGEGVWATRPSVMLWTSALVLTGILISMLSRPSSNLSYARGSGGAAFAAAAFAGTGMGGADGVARVGDYSMLSFNGGNEDVVVVLDGRAEQLFAYRILQQNQLELLERESLESMFATGRKIGPSRK